jgi:hypothetical protein
MYCLFYVKQTIQDEERKFFCRHYLLIPLPWQTEGFDWATFIGLSLIGLKKHRGRGFLRCKQDLNKFHAMHV